MRAARRVWPGIGVALAIVVSGGDVTVADTPVFEHGRTGEHALVDTESEPGAWCGYVPGDEGADLVLVRVEPPIVYARDRTPERDHQRVGWRVLLMARSWLDHIARPVAITDTRRARAWDDTPATLDRVLVPVSSFSWVSDYPNAWIRAYVEIVWYRPGDPDRVAGRSRHRVDWHRVGDSAVHRCPGWG
jgi:hypothetical protein